MPIQPRLMSSKLAWPVKLPGTSAELGSTVPQQQHNDLSLTVKPINFLFAILLPAFPHLPRLLCQNAKWRIRLLAWVHILFSTCVGNFGDTLIQKAFVLAVSSMTFWLPSGWFFLA
jgi:hypothetical protein